MLFDRTLNIALAISILFHVIIFLPLLHLKNIVQEPQPILKITYLNSKEIAPKVDKVKPIPISHVPVKTEKKEELATAVEPKKIALPEIGKKIVKLENVQKKEVVAEKTEIEIPPELPKEKESLYLSYYQTVREKIRKFVVQNYPHFIARGDVCLYFVLLPNGNLKEIKIIEERSCSNISLKEIAKKSLQQAEPFLLFPKELNQEQLSFNVIISFEAEQ